MVENPIFEASAEKAVHNLYRSIAQIMTQPNPPCPCRQNVSLSTVGYYEIGGPARWLAEPRDVRELSALLLWCRSEGLPVVVTGKGSNLLFSDEEFPGVVVSTVAMNRMWRVSADRFFCESGVENSEVASRLLQAGRGGGEWLYRLPGMIGSTVRMNGRCYGREVSEVTVGLVTVTLDGTVRWRERDEVFLGYKETSLMEGGEIVAGVMLEFPEERPSEQIRDIMDGYGSDRELKHQFDFPSCGSTFKNSYAAGRPSGQIFESLGFKGRREGGAKVSDHHANFIFNTGGAKAVEVLRLAAEMRTAAREQAGAELELELQCAGLFEASLLEQCGVPSIPEPTRPGMAWAGLMRFPETVRSDGFPRVLLQGPLFPYDVLAAGFPTGIGVSVEQLVPLAAAMREPDRPLLRWITTGATSTAFSRIPEAPAGAFLDRLWEFSVSELFIGGNHGYLEFETTPDGQWVAIRFDAPRTRSVGHETPVEGLWKGGAKPFAGASGFGMELTWRQLEPYIHDGRLSLQCCASLGNGRYGLFPWWNDPGKPDFHQPERFCPVFLA